MDNEPNGIISKLVNIIVNRRSYSTFEVADAIQEATEYISTHNNKKNAE